MNRKKPTMFFESVGVYDVDEHYDFFRSFSKGLVLHVDILFRYSPAYSDIKSNLNI